MELRDWIELARIELRKEEGQTMTEYLASHNNRARIVLRNSTGATRTLDFTR